LHNCYRRIDQDLVPQILRDLNFNTGIKRRQIKGSHGSELAINVFKVHMM